MITYRQLGNTDLNIAPLGFGGNVFGWTVDEKKSFALLDAFSAAGFNAVDNLASHFFLGITGVNGPALDKNYMPA